jgi:ABC-type molybdate transport system substrate-binding protein
MSLLSHRVVADTGVLGAFFLAALVRASPPEPLRIQATEAVAPCVEAGARAFQARGMSTVAVVTGSLKAAPAADVFAGSAVEMTRAIESGDALDDTDVAVAKIPWVVVVGSGESVKIERLSDLARPEVEVEVLGGPAAYEARRALEGVKADRVRESRDASVLKKASVALVPLSLAGPGERVPVDVPAIEARAAVATRTGRREEAQAFVSFLASEAGQRAFARCESTTR